MLALDDSTKRPFLLSAKVSTTVNAAKSAELTMLSDQSVLYHKNFLLGLHQQFWM
jgi:hypothetical protein